MINLECKMCGARNEIENSMNYFNCDACGTTNTVPKITDENRVRLFNRANYFRQKGEFDKSIKAFEGIIEEGGEDPEAKWGMILAKYGIEYVQDPHTGNRIPTCHRVHTESILTDDDYIATLDYAKDDYTRSLYEKEAKTIHEIQQGILSVAKWEESFDVFICYKESTEGGSRTVDSTLAEEIYEKLIKEGLKVFFSRITLEEKIGMQYEPYIFAALHSAKVMLLVATEVEYVNAVWVKNEWSRFITLMQKNREKIIIPCYKKMDVYDMPEQLSIYQAQDMSKIGFMQDLVRGIKKICVKNFYIESFSGKTDENTKAMLERGFICIRDYDFEKASSLFDSVLNLNPHSGYAYLGLLMIERKCLVEDELKNCTLPLEHSNNYIHIMQFGENELKQRIEEYNQFIIDENEKKAKEYLDEEKAVVKMKAVEKITKARNRIEDLEGQIVNNEKVLEKLKLECAKMEVEREVLLEKVKNIKHAFYIARANYNFRKLKEMTLSEKIILVFWVPIILSVIFLYQNKVLSLEIRFWGIFLLVVIYTFMLIGILKEVKKRPLKVEKTLDFQQIKLNVVDNNIVMHQQSINQITEEIIKIRSEKDELEKKISNYKQNYESQWNELM